MQKIILSLVLWLVTFICAPYANAADEPKTVKDGVARYATVTLVPEYTHISPGQSMRFVLEQKMQDEWHTYWVNPGDSGEATRIKWALPEGFEGGGLSFPIPERIPFGPLLNFGYNQKALFLTDITAPPIIKGDTVTLNAAVEWLICKDICVPETMDVSVTLPVARDGTVLQKANEILFADAINSMPQNDKISGNFSEGDGTLTLDFKGDNAVMGTAQGAEFFPIEWGIILNPNVQEFEKTTDGFSLRLSRDTRALSELKSIDGVVVVKDTTGKRTGYHVSIPLPTMAETPPVKTGANTQSGTTTLTLLSALFFALLGGIILNLMPCVFPILSMKALSLVKLSGKEQKQAVHSGLAYTAGIIISFLAIAGLLILLQQAGAHIGWGFQLQNPIMVLGLTYLLFLIGLNLSGYFEITGSFVTAGQSLTAKSGLSGSFFTGVLATLVATPCTAPFMGAALGFALTQPPYVALLIFTALGLGLALPYLALCVLPQARNLLPKPGTWMVTFKEFLAFPIFGSAAWLFWVYTQQIPSLSFVFTALVGGIGIVFAIWLWQKAGVTSWIKFLSILTIIGAVILSFMPHVLKDSQVPFSASEPTETSQSIHGEQAVNFTKQTLDDALKGNQAIFVNMTASWCITCKINERVALMDDSVQKFFKEKNILYIVGDWTNQNPEITDYLRSFNRNGVPIYVYYPAADSTGKRPDPIILPQLLTPSLIKDTLSPK